MKKFFCTRDAIRNYLVSDEPEPEIHAYAKDPAFRKAFVERMQHDGFEGPQCWYRATAQNYQYECDKELPEGRDRVEVPVLYIGSTEDVVCRPELMQPSIEKGLLPLLEQVELLECGHWTPFAKPGEVAEYIGKWLGKTYDK